MPKPKGHWPAGKRRHPTPADWPRIVAALNEAAGRRQVALIARKISVPRKTIYRWRVGTDLPAPHHLKPLVSALYALKLYWERTGRPPARKLSAFAVRVNPTQIESDAKP